MGILLRWIARVAWALFLVTVTIYLVRAFGARAMLPLKAEHRVELTSEFRAADEKRTDWDKYRALEGGMAGETRMAILRPLTETNRLDRHAEGNLSNPELYQPNWNRSYQLDAESVRGAAVLIHGLSDSPYSVRATAETLRDRGLTALAPRMTGHGFAVGDLRHAKWDDWMAVVRIAMRRADEIRQPGQPLILVGYSNGGLLSVRYALDCPQYEDAPCPDGLLLISPAIAVTPFARLGHWHKAVSWVPYFAQFQWESVGPEVDPYKFTSFPKNPGVELFDAAQTVERDLPLKSGNLPPILAFQSFVDDTVSTTSVIDLFRALPENGSELVLYDVNRFDRVVGLMTDPPVDLLQAASDALPLPFEITVVTNISDDSRMVRSVAFTDAGKPPLETSLGLAWPTGVFSLSHIALPFESTDPVYGLVPQEGILNIGAAAPRGERKVLSLSPNYFARLRYNPFFSYQENRIGQWLQQSFGLPAPESKGVPGQ